MAIEPRFQQGFFEALFEAAGIGLGLVDKDFKYVRVNEALAAVNGLPASAHQGKSVREVIPDLADLAEALLAQVMETRTPVLNLELSGGTPGEPDADKHFRLSYYPVFDGDEVIGVGCVVLEETAMVRGQRELIEQSHIIFEGVLQQLVVVKLALETGDLPHALRTTEKALETAKQVASRAVSE